MKRLIVITAIALVAFASCETEDSIDGKSNPSIEFNEKLTYGTMTDQNGNTYKTIQIGTQTWMAENLRTTNYNDGTPILSVSDLSTWGTLTTGAASTVNKTTKSDSILLYGRYYNWYAVNSQKLAPAGWHIPTYNEITTLISFLGGEAVAGGKLKEAGTKHWKADNLGATNESGYTALPAGYLSASGYFESVGSGAYFWCKDAYGVYTAWDIYLFYNSAALVRNFNYKTSGFSVRCVKD